MPKQYIDKWFSNEGTRQEVRNRIIDTFEQEPPGCGTGDDCSKTIYYVETLKNGDRVFLCRPAALNKGFDFLIRVENTDFGHRGGFKNVPSHKDISADLELKKAEDPEGYKKLYGLLKKVFECHDLSDEEYSMTSFESGFSSELILKVIKWLFIEQDVTYWNWSGRNMTWGLVPDPE